MAERGAETTRARSLLKPLLIRAAGARRYGQVLAAAKAWDIRTGRWTETEVEALPEFVGPGDVALDVGANYGLYTYHLSRIVGPAGHVYAFEPMPDVLDAHRTVTRLLRLRNATLVPKGIAEREGVLTFQSPVQECGAIVGGLSRMVRGEAQRDPSLRETTAAVTTLDGFVAGAGLRDVRFVKCDIEGAELFAFRGATRLLAEQRPSVLCEIGAGLLRERYGVSAAELAGLFADHGYGSYRWMPDTGRLRPMDLTIEDHDGNYFFVHADDLRARGLFT